MAFVAGPPFTTANPENQGDMNALWQKLQEIEDTLLVGPWRDADLLNSWVAFGSGWAPAQFMKRPDGFVVIQGLIKDGTITDGTDLFILPEGLRPAETLLFTLTTDPASLARVDVYANGTVEIRAAIDNTFLSLTGISFLAEGR